MDARTGLVIGGVTAVAASVAVVTAVALANTAALNDSEGTSVASEHVVVPAAANPSATPRPTPAATPDALTPSSEPEVVAAPAPVVVAPAEPDAGRAPAAPPAAPQAAQPAPPSPPAVPGDLDAAIAAAKAEGTWDGLRTWATTNGWSSGRVDALIARLDREAADESAQRELNTSPSTSNVDRQGLVSPAPAEQEAVVDQRSHGSQRPADAGTNVGNGNGAAGDGKKDQSRNSPDKRD